MDGTTEWTEETERPKSRVRLAMLDGFRGLGYSGVAMTTQPPTPLPFAAQAVPFHEFLATGKLPDGLITSDYVAEQFVERLVHYVLSVPAGSYTMGQLGTLLEQLDPRHQILFFKRLKEISPQSLKDFAPLYYGFMAEFHALLFT